MARGVGTEGKGRRIRLFLIELSRPISGGGKDQGEQLSGIGGVLDLRPCTKSHLTENQTPEDYGIWRSTKVVQVRVKETWRERKRENPPGVDRYLVAGRG